MKFDMAVVPRLSKMELSAFGLMIYLHTREWGSLGVMPPRDLPEGPPTLEVIAKALDLSHEEADATLSALVKKGAVSVE